MRISDWSSDVCSSDLLAVGKSLRIGERAFEQRADIDRRALDRERSRLALRKVEHIVDLPAEPADRIHDRVHIGALLVATLAGLARLQHTPEAADRGGRQS